MIRMGYMEVWFPWTSALPCVFSFFSFFKDLFSFCSGGCVYLLIYFQFYSFIRPHGVFVVAHGLSLVGVSGAALHGGAWLHSAVASRCKAQALGHRFQQLQHMGFSSGDAQVQLLCSTRDLPGPGNKPLSPALAGRVSSTGPPGKPWSLSYKER